MNITFDEFEDRIEKAYELLKNCRLCPRVCQKDRTSGQFGECNVGQELEISSYGPHYGEEFPLVGYDGSGTIFLTSCNLRCIFCQNYDISHLQYGEKVSIEHCAHLMLLLQNRGCHNINFVTPTHFTPQLMKAVLIAIKNGLKVPIVYNCGGYESIQTIKLLDGIVDIYMPDAKYSDEKTAVNLSNAPGYYKVIKSVLKEMHRQVGDLVINSKGIAQRGLLVRHLVLPNRLAGTEQLMRFISEEISKNTYINIMDQYRPCYQASEKKQINRRITPEEYSEAIEIAQNFGLHRIDSLVVR